MTGGLGFRSDRPSPCGKRRGIWNTEMRHLIMATAVASLLTGVSASESYSGKPNILLILADQHCAGVMGCAGDGNLRTPALDSLARHGIRFGETYCCYPVCTASRASIMTGRLPHVLKDSASDEEKDSSKRPEIPGKSLGRLMKEAGYETAYFGKWHVGGVNPSPQNSWHGFDILRDGRRDEETAREAVAFLESKHEKPFFLVVSFVNPHDICEWARLKSGLKDHMPNGEIPLDPPLRKCPSLPQNFAIPPDEPEIVSLRRASQPERAHPTLKWGETEWRQYRWAYCRLIEKMDREVGKVLSALDRSGYGTNTLVVYTSDHGDGNASHHWNQKMVLYEEAAKTPLIVSWPGRTREGAVEMNHLVSTGLDLLPTFCDYAGIAAPPDLTGMSLRPFAEKGDPAATPKERPYLVVSELDYGGLIPGRLTHGILLRTKDHTYIAYSEGNHPEQLFDIRNDPGQTRNLAGDPSSRDILREHRRIVREWIAQSHSPFPAERIP